MLSFMTNYSGGFRLVLKRLVAGPVDRWAGRRETTRQETRTKAIAQPNPANGSSLVPDPNSVFFLEGGIPARKRYPVGLPTEDRAGNNLLEDRPRNEQH